MQPNEFMARALITLLKPNEGVIIKNNNEKFIVFVNNNADGLHCVKCDLEDDKYEEGQMVWMHVQEEVH